MVVLTNFYKGRDRRPAGAIHLGGEPQHSQEAGNLRVGGTLSGPLWPSGSSSVPWQLEEGIPSRSRITRAGENQGLPVITTAPRSTARSDGPSWPPASLGGGSHGQQEAEAPEGELTGQSAPELGQHPGWGPSATRDLEGLLCHPGPVGQACQSPCGFEEWIGHGPKRGAAPGQPLLRAEHRPDKGNGEQGLQGSLRASNAGS